MAAGAGISMLLSWVCTKKGYICLQSCFKIKHEWGEITSDDFYNEINLKFIINEYERAKENKNHYEQILINNKDGTSSFEKNKVKYIKFI